jgi:hypothetical protein
MSDISLRSLRDLLKDRPQGLTFADLPSTVLEDLALGWSGGRSTAEVAAELASRIDGIPKRGRDKEIAGRAVLTLLQRRGAPVAVAAPSDHVRFLGNAAADEGDPEGTQAFERRESEYDSLDALPADAYEVADFQSDLAGAFAAAKLPAPADLPADPIGAEHPLALLCTALPGGLRGWFHDHYSADRADAYAWKFVLVGRAIAHHRNGMLDTGVLSIADADAKVPEALVSGLLALPLGQLARTAILEPF